MTRARRTIRRSLLAACVLAGLPLGAHADGFVFIAAGGWFDSDSVGGFASGGNTTHPTGCVDGGVEFLVYQSRTSGTSFNTPSGFTCPAAWVMLDGSGRQLGVCYKETVGGESGNLAVSWSTSDRVSAQPACFSTDGADGYTTLTTSDTPTTAINSSAEDIPTAARTITSGAANRLVLFAGASSSFLTTPLTAPASSTRIGDESQAATVAIGWSYLLTNSNVAASVFASSTSGNNASRAITIPIIPPAVATGGAGVFGGPFKGALGGPLE